MTKFYKLLSIIFLLSSICLMSQGKDCILHEGYWTPELSNLPLKTNVKLDNLEYILYYRYHIKDSENKFYIESIESNNNQDINISINNYGSLNLLLNYLMVEFIKSQKSATYSWNILNDSSKVLSIDILKKITWKIINNISSSSDSKQSIIPCTTDMCLYTYITINQTNDNSTISIREFQIKPELKYYGEPVNDPECISIINYDPQKYLEKFPKP